MHQKSFIQAQDLIEDSFRLGVKIIQSGFRPNFIIGIWRGGTPVGIAVQELLDYYGIETDHISIRTSSYEDIDRRGKQIKVHGLDYLIDHINAEDALLIVDDVFDTGLSIEAVLDTLEKKARRNTPREIRIATAYFKPRRNLTQRTPDYYIHETDHWLIFPHELSGLSMTEIHEGKAWLKEIIRDL